MAVLRWPCPHSSKHFPLYSPLFNNLNVVATFILPGIASIFTPLATFLLLILVLNKYYAMLRQYYAMLRQYYAETIIISGGIDSIQKHNIKSTFR